MPLAFAPVLKPLGIEDREQNQAYVTVVHKPQIEDVIKACRKAGVTAKPFTYDRDAWAAEKREIKMLKEQFENKRKAIN